jgi:hypothetical protein
MMREYFNKFWRSFHDSEVILWARLQFLLLALYTALQSVDMSQVISDGHLLQGYMFTNAFVTELLRRRNAEWKQ